MKRRQRAKISPIDDAAMMDVTFEYRGFHTTASFNTEDNKWHWKVEDISDSIFFESKSISDIERRFHSAVDAYILIANP